MVDMNEVIANNINDCLIREHKKQVELAAYLDVSRQTMSKMLSGVRSISAVELKMIAAFFGTSMETLTTIPQNWEKSDVFHVFMGQVKTEEARQAIRDIDYMIDLILFHSKVKENGMEMREEWSDF
jgi:plasmid maintenance system antidote protein VapI